MMTHHYEAPFGPERIPFRVVVALFAMDAMTCFQSAFLPWAPFCHATHGIFQAETLNMGIAAAQG